MSVRACACVCVLGKVSEEDLSGTQDDVCSGAAELGHGRMVEGRRSVGGPDDTRWREIKTPTGLLNLKDTQRSLVVRPPDPPAQAADFRLSPFVRQLKPESV